MVQQERQRKGGGRALFSTTEGDAQCRSGRVTWKKGSDSKPLTEVKKRSSLPTPTVSGLTNNMRTGIKPERIFLKVDERQRQAQERRKEREKQLAAREAAWLQREERARQHQERQLAERRRRLAEQRLREERRRAAVEEKRRRRLEEEKERHEAVVRKTLERSQRANPRMTRWAWRGGPPGHSAASTNASGHPLSTVSLKSLPRVAFGSVDYGRPRDPPSSAMMDKQEKEKGKQSWNGLSVPTAAATVRPRAPANPQSRVTAPPAERTSHNPSQRPHQTLQGTPTQQPRRESPESSHAHSARSMEAVRRREGGCGREEEEHAEGVAPDTQPSANATQPATTEASNGENDSDQAALSAAPPPVGLGKPRAGTMDPEEATRMLADRRRQAREQREREEEERRQREESERRAREETARKMAEERARREEEAQRLAEERRKREEEEKNAAEERQREEAERLHKQREEEEARQRQEEELLRLEREKHFQKEEAERLERKKRLEEIMKRTRRPDPADKKSVSHGNGELPQQKSVLPSEQETPSETVTQAQPEEAQSPVCNGSSSPSSTLPPADWRGTTVDAQVIENCIPSRKISLPKLDMSGEDIVIPVMAYRRAGPLRTRPSMGDITSPQRAEVI
ncbi:hypothetical protein MATL_G00156690 [Megalops atlanticus]|uniref:Ensconsin-like n=1 Tax=Megalops atlanticus TaxID=7932 RepID=A0A9D3PU96_MEGAT|nr:hypothetical protein MATL_G00156690 [Megalops atlanticus]